MLYCCSVWPVLWTPYATTTKRVSKGTNVKFFETHGEILLGPYAQTLAKEDIKWRGY